MEKGRKKNKSKIFKKTKLFSVSNFGGNNKLPEVADWELTASGESGAGELLRALYSTVGERCPSPIVQGRFGGLAHSSTILRFSVKELGRGPGLTHRPKWGGC